MKTAAQKKPRTGLVEQAGVQGKNAGCLVAQEAESGKENISGPDMMELEIEALTPEESERCDKVDRFLTGINYDQKMFLFLVIGLSHTTIRVDPERLVLVCRKLATMTPESFELLADRLEAYAF